MRLTIDQFRNVVGSQTIDESDRVTAANVNLAHVRHIEKSRVCARAQMFFDRTGGILDGHVPTAEVDHASTKLPVGVVEWGTF